MKVTIKDADKYSWYINHVGKEFEIRSVIHPTFKYREYVLQDTEFNREMLENDWLTLACLKNGHMGIKYQHACNCNNSVETDNGWTFISITPCGYHSKCEEED
jgi:hypothetical protein